MSGRNGSDIGDRDQRRRALETGRSFIVQAPAGSGKTELLTQRFLKLLSAVEQPEEILAMTFTRKAAGEMRERVLGALDDARHRRPVSERHQQLTRQLADAALERDRDLEWNLLGHPSRLRITTIDGFNATLARAVPLLAGQGLGLDISDDPRALYREAALRQMRRAGQDADSAEGGLLAHLDNRLGPCVDMLAEALAARELWLSTVMNAREHGTLRAELEAALQRQVDRQVRSIADAMGEARCEELLHLLAIANANNKDLLPGHEDPDFSTGPTASWFWRFAAQVLLKNDGAWRKTVDVRQGFPPKDTAKAAILQMLGDLAAEDGLAEQLEALRKMPVVAYPDQQWHILERLLEVLPACAAQLQLIFVERGEADYTAVSQAALAALGNADGPSDLLLALDYRIRHVLIDEFQDTSQLQIALLNLLTEGWEEGDGRSLMVVGDPMQSIYRFRKAEVALFLECRERGLDNGRLALEPLTLSANFRSQEKVVDWFNGAFATVMAGPDELAVGRVAFSPSEAVLEALPGDAVTVWPHYDSLHKCEADQVVRIAAQALSELDTGTVAILVRARSHLSEILPHLRRAGMRFRTVDTEFLKDRQVIEDLLAITRAVLHPADRAAWLAMLRAPWCGLDLADLDRLLGGSKTATVPELLVTIDPKRLSTDGAQRVARVAPVLLLAVEHRGRRRLREQVEGLWLRLGGAAILDDPADIDNAESYFRLLEKHDRAGEPPDLFAIERQLDQLYAAPDPAGDPRLQLMTIYAAKGLEFDTVIIPGLGRATQDKGRPLLRWTRVVEPGSGHEALLMAPLSPTGEDSDPFFAWLKKLSSIRDRYESDRLLYVACTRAKQQLHLLGNVSVNEKTGESKPASGSLLARLWPVVGQHYLDGSGVSGQAAEPGDDRQPAFGQVRRLAADWHLADAAPAIEHCRRVLPAAETSLPIEFDWVRETLRLIGTVVHGELEIIGRDGTAAWDTKKLATRKPRWRAALLSLGLPESALATAIDGIDHALTNTLSDQRGLWILDPAHQEAHCEWALSGIDRGEVINVVLDRSFVDADGMRWIIDYKTSRHEGGDLDAFVEEQRQRYGPQLERYAKLVAGLEQRPQKLGLYFPLLKRWIEWSP